MAEQTLLHRSARLEPRASSAGEARRMLRQALAEVGETGALDSAQLAVSELVTNAVLHAATAVELTLDITATDINVSVRDWHPRLPTPRHWGTTATTGRGLGLVASLSDEFGVEPQPPVGKAVWFRLHRGEPAPAGEVGADWALEDLQLTPDGSAATQVFLRGLPARLWAAGQQHWEAVLRELYLYAQSNEAIDAEIDLAAAGQALVTISTAVDRAVSSAAGGGSPEQRPAGRPPVPYSVDAELSVSGTEQAGFGLLQDALDAAIRLGGESRLLIRPALPEVIALRDWACEQVLAQAHGVPPTPWAGSAHPRFLDPEVVQHTTPVPAWDEDVVITSTRAVVAADDSNRIVAVSKPAADLLGWDRAELTGRRVVTIVPPSLREAHVAGFTRHLTTGETHVLGVALELPVLRADGIEIPCRFLIERAAAEVGRAVYVAWIEPIGD